MKNIKKIIALMLSIMLALLCFSGCSRSDGSEEITSSTMLIAYRQEVKPFIYTENGELTGFDVELFKTIFKDIKGDYKDYRFVQVDEDYKIGEDVYCVDSEGKDCIAYVLAGGVQKDFDDINNTHSFTNAVINNRVVTITKDGFGVSDYTALNGKDVGVVGDVAMSALDKNSTVKAGMKSIAEYSDISSALAELDTGKIQAVVVDEFNCNVEDLGAYITLDGELENISYVYALKKWDWYKDSINEAIYELKSPDYNDADEFTPIVEKYFGYNASCFEYNPVEQ